MSLKLVIFDLDGTLVDTVMDITDALNHVLKQYCIKELSVEDTKKMVGEGVTRLIEKALGEKKNLPGNEVKKQFLDYYSEHLIGHSNLYPHVKEVLEVLAGYKKAVISNKREYLSTKLLKELGIREYFDIIVGSDTTSERKPSAVPVIYVLERLNIDPAEAVIVGDSNYDVEAGKKAGIKTIAVTYGYNEKQNLMEADYLIDRIKDLPVVLDIISA